FFSQPFYKHMLVNVTFPVDSLSFCYRVLNEKWTNQELVHSESNVDFNESPFP
ncbi:hypothetical protein OS493_037631, partial [Desmophyllum pertusum]